MRLALCVVGCGRYAKTFARAVRSFDGFQGADQIELLFASRNIKRAESYCRRFGGSGAFGDYEEAAADPRVQALYFCTPHHLHMEQALMAARHSKHILVEKPIARTLEEGERMVEAARDASVKLMVAENYRFMPVVWKSRELIAQGTIGKVRFMQVQEESNFIVDTWRADRQMMGGGVFIDGGIHSVDMLIALGGMAQEVYASRLPQALDNVEGEDGIVVMTRLQGGATGLINHAWGISKRAWKLWVAISGTKGRIYFEPGVPTMVLEAGEGRSTFRLPEDRAGIGRMVEEFRDSIAEDHPPLTSGEVGLRDLKVLLRAYESADRGVPLAVE